VSPNEGDHGDRARFRIAIRPEFNGRPPRPEALQVDGRREGWPDDAPVWIASGDLQPAE